MRFTLSGGLSAAIGVLVAVLGGLFFLLDRASTQIVDAGARQLRQVASDRVNKDIEGYFLEGERALDGLDQALRAGTCSGSGAESCLLSVLMANSNFAEVSLTQGTDLGFDENDNTRLAVDGRRQLTLFRGTKAEQDQICTRDVTGAADEFVARVWCRSSQLILQPPVPALNLKALDPTAHPGFRTPASDGRRGRTLWSDLSYAQLDDQLPEPQQRVVVYALRGVESPEHRLLGVVRVGLLAEKVAQLVAAVRVNPGEALDEYKIFVADEQGRLITGLCAEDTLRLEGDDIRVWPHDLAADVRAALAHPSLASVTAERPNADDRLELAGRRYFVGYRLLQRTVDGAPPIGPPEWRVGIVGPVDFYLGPFQAQRRQMLFVTVGVLTLLLFSGGLVLWVIRNAFTQFEHGTTQMSAFDFSASPVRSPFADVRDALLSVEKAKTAVRAMGKYVPLALVRRLFEDNREPVLGGALKEVTIFFSDIEGFTTRAEAEPPDVVAQWLGRYLEVMTDAVHAEGGTVDKFIGDSVMALWNAPRAHADHAELACRAALRCQRETKKLYESPEWKGRAPLVTRIGLHLDSVMVGHFGAPDRLSYTAIGDGVNLASRLEGLNKRYGTTMLASEEVYQRAKGKFAFRRIDLVAVKGKLNAVGVYELLGELDQPGVGGEAVRRYEQALAIYARGDFAAARAVLSLNLSDEPSRLLARRCGELEKNPPLHPWDGVSHADTK